MAKTIYEKEFTLQAWLRLGGEPVVLSGTLAGDDTILKVRFERLSLEKIINDLIQLVRPSYTLELPYPWDQILGFELRDLVLSYNIKQKSIGFESDFEFAVPLLELKRVYIDAKSVYDVRISFDGAILGNTYEGDNKLGWNLVGADGPPTAPPPPSLFDLKFLGLGQRLRLTRAARYEHVSDAINDMASLFDPPGEGALVPSFPDALVFDNNSNWLFGLDAEIMDTVALSIVFNDPNLYGLFIGLKGNKAKSLAGLEFEILYKKITDDIGVYQIELKLPAYIRSMEFGAVSVTLPQIGVDIYTNGNFKIDFGFPRNMVFTNSFAVQVFPFVGFGGFYFAVLNGATSSTLPVTNNGKFNPVLEFGIGLQLGVGKTIDKGILQASATLTFVGIVEGTLAWFEASNSKDSNNLPVVVDSTLPDFYYRLNGTFAIVGKIWGGVHFAIVSATLDLTVYASATVVIEACEPILLSFSAGVSVSLRVSVDLGLFTIHVRLSFHTTISYQFSLGSSSNAQWKPQAVLPHSATHPHGRAPVLAALTDEERERSIQLDWTAVFAEDKPQRVDLYYFTQFSIADQGDPANDPSVDDTKPRVVGIGMLFAPSSEQSGNNAILSSLDNIRSELLTFEQIALTSLCWAINAAMPRGEQADSLDKLLGGSVTQVRLASILYSLDHGAQNLPISYAQIIELLKSLFILNIRDAPDLPEDSENGKKPHLNLSLFPMIPELFFKPQNRQERRFTDIDNQVDPDSLLELVNRYSMNQQRADTMGTESSPDSLVTLLFRDYFKLLIKTLVQSALDAMQVFKYRIPAALDEGNERVPPTLARITRRFTADEISPADVSAIAVSNQNNKVLLKQGGRLRVPGIRYSIEKGDSLASILAGYGLLEEGHDLDDSLIQRLIGMNGDAELFISGRSIAYRASERELGDGDTLRALIQPLNSDAREIADFINGLKDRTDILRVFKQLQLPVIEHDISENDTLLGIADRYQVDLKTLALANQDNETILRDGEQIIIENVRSLNTGELISYLNHDGALGHAAGIASRFFMYGLRLPVADGQGIDGAEVTGAMYLLSGQQFVFDFTTDDETGALSNGQVILGKVSADSTVQQEQPDPLSWISFHAEKSPPPARLEHRFLPAEIAIASAYEQAHFAPTIEHGPVSIKLYNDQLKTYPLANPIYWQTESSETSAASPGIWLFPPSLRAVRHDSPRLRLVTGTQPQKNAAMKKDEIDGEKYRWSTLLPVTIRKVDDDSATSGITNNTYEVYGTDAAGIELLTQLVTKTSVIEDTHILFPSNPERNEANALQSYGGDSLTLLINTNLSTETNPDTLIPTAENGQQGIPGTTPHDMVVRLWKSSLVRTGGYYLYIRNAEGKGLPANLFSGGQTTDIYLLITFNETHEVKGYMNSVCIHQTVNSEHSVLFAEWSVPQDEKGRIKNPDKWVKERKIARIPAIQPGNAGFKLVRTNPNILYPQTGNKGERKAPFLYQLETQYNLLDFEIIDNEAFENKGEGLAVSPEKDYPGEDYSEPAANAVQTTDLTEPWTYKRAFPLKKVIKPNSDKPTAYLGLNQELEMGFCWRDNYGNRLQHKDDLGLKLHIRYFDYLVPLSQWPHTAINYEFTEDPGAVGNFRINFLFHAANEYKIVSDPDNADDFTAEINALKDKVSGDLSIFERSLDQIRQHDVELSFRVSLTPDLQEGYPRADRRQLKKGLIDFLTKTEKQLKDFLTSLEHAAETRPTIESVAYDWTEEVTDTNGDNLFPLEVEFSIRRDKDLIDPAFEHVPQVECVKTLIKPESENMPLLITAREPDLTSFINDLDAALLPSSIARRFNVGDAEVSKGDQEQVWQVKTRYKNFVIRAEDDGLYWQDPAAGLSRLAESFEGLFSGAKVTSAYTRGTQQQEVWIVRFKSAADKAGIGFKVLYDQALFYAPQPLSTHPVSLTGVSINVHTDYGASDPERLVTKTFSMVDPETWALDYLETLEETLRPEFSIPITMFDNLIDNNQAGNGFLYSILQAKLKVADAIALQTIPILEDATMQTAGLGVAREKIKQQLLINLVDGYRTNAVVQYSVDVVSDYPNQDQSIVEIAPNLFGQPFANQQRKAISNVDDTDDVPNYSLSTGKVALKGNQDDEALPARSYLTFLFSTQTERYRSEIPLDIKYSVNHLEFDIRSIDDGLDSADPDSISRYSVSKWLSFVKPLLPEPGESETTYIPIPVRQYPRLPALVGQQFTTPNDSPGATDIQAAKRIDYRFSYRLPEFTAQDTVHGEVLFNSNKAEEDAVVRLARATDDLDRNLQMSLARFHEAREPMVNELRTLLALVGEDMGEEIKTRLKRLLASYDYLVNQVADTWFERFNPDNLNQQGNHSLKVITAKFDLVEDEDRDNLPSAATQAPGLFRISLSRYSVTSENRGVHFIALPSVLIDDYQVEAYGYEKDSDRLHPITPNNRYNAWDKVHFYYYRTDGQQRKTYLSFDQGKDILDRTIAFADLDVLQVQNAWAGFNVVRNARLSHLKPTSEEFIYRTPLKRFTNPVTPMLDVTEAIDLADAEDGKSIELERLLTSMVERLLEPGGAAQQPSEQDFQPSTLKILTSYSFTSNPNVGPILQPCFLLPPMRFDQQDTTPDGAGIRLLRGGIIDWFGTHTPVQSGGRLYFDITFYSLMADDDLPVLRLRQLFIDVEKIATLRQYAG